MYYDAEKVYIDCEVLWQKDSQMIPCAVYWPDASGLPVRHEITAVEGCSEGEILSDTGFLGKQYIVHIGGRRRRLYYEKNSGLWFVEIKKST